MATTNKPPVMPVRATATKLDKKLDAERTRAVFQTVLMWIALTHFVLAVVLGGGLSGYIDSWRNLFDYLLANPLIGLVIPGSFLALYKGIDMWRHPDPAQVTLPRFRPIPDLRFRNELYIGSGWTHDGKQPGEVVDFGEELFDKEDVHVVLREKGLFGNVHCKGGVGGGKTSTLIMPVIDQAIAKYPKPLPPERFDKDREGRYKASAGRAPEQAAARWPLGGIRGRLGLEVEEEDESPHSAPPISDWNPYVGMTEEEAQTTYQKLLREHEKLKWGLFVIDPKGDLTEFVQRVAALAGREDDVIVLRPDGEYTYNPLGISANPLVQAEMVMDGIEAVSGQAIQQYWRGTMSEWLANALTILKVVDPTRITFKTVLRMARNEALRTSLVAEAEAIMRQAQEEEERLRRLGKPYKGVRVNPAAIEFFRDWDDEEADPSLKRAVVSGIKMQSKFFVDDELAPFLCPEMPPTFDGFDNMIDEGKIVVLRMPLDQYGPVAKVMGILVLADAQQAARARINRPDMNQERVVAFVVDEISAYLNKLTKDFIAMNRQSRVCFLAAHQSQGQLVQHGDRGFETSFNDNLRTKISYNAPNAEAARKESGIYGSRLVFRETWTESQNFQRIERKAGSDSFSAKGPENKGASVRWDEVERAWFPPEDFMGLKTGECVIMEFDGTTTLHPRKVVAPAFWQGARQKAADAVKLPDRLRKPHPIVYVGGGDRNFEYLVAGISQTGFVVVEPLANAAGDLEGFKFVTDIGTILAPCDLLEEIRDALADRLCDPETLVAFTDIVTCTSFFADSLGMQFERVIDLPGVYHAFFPASGDDLSFSDIFGAEAGRTPHAPLKAGWEFHTDLSTNRKRVLEDSRLVIDLFTKLGGHLAEFGDDAIEDIFEETRERIDALRRGEADPGTHAITRLRAQASQAPGQESSVAHIQEHAMAGADTQEGEESGVDSFADVPSPQDFGQDFVEPDFVEPEMGGPFEDGDDPFLGESYPSHLEAEERSQEDGDDGDAESEADEGTQPDATDGPAAGGEAADSGAGEAVSLPGLELPDEADAKSRAAPKPLKRARRKRPKADRSGEEAIRTLLDVMYAEADEESDEDASTEGLSPLGFPQDADAESSGEAHGGDKDAARYSEETLPLPLSDSESGAEADESSDDDEDLLSGGAPL